MIMELKCPYCGSESIAEMDPEYDWDSDTECIVTWDAHCECGKTFIVSEIVKVTSRIVARDCDDLEKLIDEEDKKCIIGL